MPVLSKLKKLDQRKKIIKKTPSELGEEWCVEVMNKHILQAQFGKWVKGSLLICGFGHSFWAVYHCQSH
jgi:hypothetical protein